MKDICRNKYGDNQESAAAFETIKLTRAESRMQVLIALREHGGLTCKELAALMGKPMHAVSGRISELKAMGFAEPTAELRDGGRVIIAAGYGDNLGEVPTVHLSASELATGETDGQEKR